ncbi:MAG TPA: prepilin-type N-terminal cleavage/methylation domain-containing protein [Candidatus Paceibacterota bacterium]|nr:prepilin-type N-terminal cleavage/methylation domain-containing protein [Candidatus Paceibacterota bacterium]
MSSVGFTLLEMLIVLAIISVIIGIVVVNQRSFDNSIILSTTAYDVALSIREAEAYGFAGRGVTGGGGVVSFPVSYGTGIDFNIATNNTYTLFADTYTSPSSVPCYPSSSTGPSNSPAQKTGDCVFEPPPLDVTLSTFNINNGITISKIDDSAGTSLSKLDIVFARGEVTNKMSATQSGGGTLAPNPPSFTTAHIELASSDKAAHACITVTTANIISVDQGTCP